MTTRHSNQLSYSRAKPLGNDYGAEDGIRTRDLLHGKQMLYQLSYFRIYTIQAQPSLRKTKRHM